MDTSKDVYMNLFESLIKNHFNDIIKINNDRKLNIMQKYFDRVIVANKIINIYSNFFNITPIYIRKNILFKYEKIVFDEFEYNRTMNCNQIRITAISKFNRDYSIIIDIFFNRIYYYINFKKYNFKKLLNKFRNEEGKKYDWTFLLEKCILNEI